MVALTFFFDRPYGGRYASENLFEIDSTFLDIEVVLAKLSRAIYLQVTVNNHGHKASPEGAKIVKGLPVLVNHTPQSCCWQGRRGECGPQGRVAIKAIVLLFIPCLPPIFITDKQFRYHEDPSRFFQHVNGRHSTVLNVTCEISQGSVLSLVMFALCTLTRQIHFPLSSSAPAYDNIV